MTTRPGLDISADERSALFVAGIVASAIGLWVLYRYDAYSLYLWTHGCTIALTMAMYGVAAWYDRKLEYAGALFGAMAAGPIALPFILIWLRRLPERADVVQGVTQSAEA